MHYKILGESFIVFGYNQILELAVRSIHARNYFKYNTYVSACAPFDVKYKKTIQIHTNSCTNQHATLYSFICRCFAVLSNEKTLVVSIN